MNIKLTKQEALRIQAEQIAWYNRSGQYPWLAAKLASMTTADALEDDVEYPAHIINRHIPRGGSIEYLLGMNPRNYD